MVEIWTVSSSEAKFVYLSVSSRSSRKSLWQAPCPCLPVAASRGLQDWITPVPMTGTLNRTQSCSTSAAAKTLAAVCQTEDADVSRLAAI